MALMRMILLAIFRALWVQRESLASNLSRRSVHEACFRADTIMGAPRYLEGSLAMVKPKIRAIEF